MKGIMYLYLQGKEIVKVESVIVKMVLSLSVAKRGENGKAKMLL